MRVFYLTCTSSINYRWVREDLLTYADGGAVGIAMDKTQVIDSTS